MNIKSLLLGSAAALAVVSGAQAADAIVAAAPEPAEYVKVCDAFGTGYFYIPGTETCLKIGGYVRYEIGFDSSRTSASTMTAPGAPAINYNSRKWNSSTKADINATAKSDTEFGALTGFIEFNATTDDYSKAGGFVTDAAYLEIAGFKAGYFAGYFDAGIGEGSSWAAASKFNAISYTYTGDGITLGLGLDEIREASYSKVIDTAYVPETTTTQEKLATFKDRNNNGLGIEGLASVTFGGITASLIGVYDTDTSNGAVKGILSSDVGPGTLKLAGVWSSGENVYTGMNTFNATTGALDGKGRKWAIGAAYKLNATDRLSIMPEIQTGETLENSAGKSGKEWLVGALTTYQLTDGLAASLDINYNSKTDPAGVKSNSVTGYFRLQRSF